MANGDAAYAISVRRLADQYRLTDLVTEVDHEFLACLGFRVLGLGFRVISY